MRWTVLEASTKTMVRLLQKILGTGTATVGAAMGVITLTGLVQFIMGLICLKNARPAITSDRKGKVGAVLFGIGALASNICALKAFQLGGSVIVVTFITTLSMFFGALLDRFWFKHKFAPRQWVGLGVGMGAGYAMLNFPSLSEALTLPLWVWFAFGNMVSLVMNQWIVQTIKDIHPYAKNVWGGGSTCVFGAVLFFIAGGMGNLTLSATTFMAASVAIGVVTFFMWAFSLFAYKEGAYISLKKLVMNASYMAMTVVVGVVWFKEFLTLSHTVGFALYLAAIIMMDEKVYKTLWSLRQRRQTPAL